MPIPYTHTCVWQSTIFEVFVSILEVLEKYSCRILRSIRPYIQKYTAVYLEYTGTLCLPPIPPFSSTTPPPPVASTHDSRTPKHIVHTKQNDMSKAEDHKKHSCLMSPPKCQM